jgi:MerR family transcriptional regulator, copper efflux regulator
VLIARFAQRTGLSVDTVRYYVRRGLLHPAAGTRGGRNPYQEFTDADLDDAAIIRNGQALGLKLDEISTFLSDYRSGKLGGEDLVIFLEKQRDRLMAKVKQLNGLIAYLDAKIAWVKGGQVGELPQVEVSERPGRAWRRESLSTD